MVDREKIQNNIRKKTKKKVYVKVMGKNTVCIITVTHFIMTIQCLRKNLNASRHSEHNPVKGGNVKTFRWDHRVQIQNLFMAFNRVPR